MRRSSDVAQSPVCMVLRARVPWKAVREPGAWITLVVMIDPAAGAGASRPAAGRLRVRVPAMLAGVALVAAAPDREPGAWLAAVGADFGAAKALVDRVPAVVGADLTGGQ